MNLKDTITISKIIVGASLVLVLIYLVLDSMATANAGSSALNQDVLEDARDGFAVGDYMIPFLVIALGLVSIVLSSQIDSHPTYFLYVVILLMITSLITTIVANIVILLLDSTALSSASTAFPLTRLVFQNWPFIIGFLIVMDGIFVVSKWR